MSNVRTVNNAAALAGPMEMTTEGITETMVVKYDASRLPRPTLIDYM